MLLYWILGALGALCICFGVVILFHANNLKRDSAKWVVWFGIGTLGLVFFAAGNSFMIDAAVHLSHLVP